jgi:hypothetical protein
MKMTVKSEVQGVVQALFGAYAGGYLAELTAEATANGIGAVAARLASVQGIILGKDLSSNATFVDTILSNLGVTSTNAAYTAAADWANGELTKGASRADIVSSAVAFLDGIAAGTIVDSKYTAIATAYAAKVAAGVTFSESAAGSKVLSVNDLQQASGISEAFNLTIALDKLKSADKAVADYIDAWGLKQTPVVAAADSIAGDVYTKLATAEAAVEIKAVPAILGIAGATQAALDATTETAGFATYKTSDNAENLALTIAQAEIATKKIALDGALAAAVTSLADFDGSQALVDTWIAKATAATAAATAATAAGVVTASKAAAADIALDTAFDSATSNHTFVVTQAQGSVTFSTTTVGGTAFKSYEGTYNALTNAWTFTEDDGVNPPTTLTAAQVTANTNLQKLLANADSKAVLDAAAAEAEAVAASDVAAAAQSTALDAVTAAHQSLTNGNDLAGAADAYRDAKKDLTDHATAKTAFEKAVSDQTAARADAAELAALEKAAAAAKDAIGEAGWDINDQDPGNSQDLFVFAKANITPLSNFTSEDLVFMGTAYTLSNLPAAKVPGTHAIGSATALEIFWDVANEKLFVEKAAFSGDASGPGNFYEITLTGVAADAALTYINGYIALA